MFDDIDQALADCTHVAGMTARQRTAKRNAQRPREAAPELWAAAEEGTAALVMGPEDKGLTNEELDRCHRSIVVPTNPEYQALNLAQAFTLMAYELHLARGERSLKTPRKAADPATAADLELIFGDAEAALSAIDFFKTRNPDQILRTVREMVHRTPMDAREAKLVRAMCIEVVRYLERTGRG
jgi:TrmH family RNA methyltransferase